MLEILLVSLLVILACWFSYFFLMWAVNDDSFFDGGVDPEEKEGDEAK